MNTKKTETLTIRIDAETKEALQEYATKHEWTLSFSASKILKSFFEDKKKMKQGKGGKPKRP